MVQVGAAAGSVITSPVSREVWLRTASPKRYRAAPVDVPQAQVVSLVPSPSAAPTSGATEYRTRTRKETELCETGRRVDWAYLGAMVLADAGTIILDSEAFQANGHAAVRLVGPGLVGLSWGWSIGGTYLTLPQCSPDFVHAHPFEGDVRSEWPLAISFTILAGVMAPVIVGVETGEGTETLQWSPTERVMRLVIASGAGIVGSLMPYVLPPRTWRAMKKLENLRGGADAHAGFISYAVRF